MEYLNIKKKHDVILAHVTDFKRPKNSFKINDVLKIGCLFCIHSIK